MIGRLHHVIVDCPDPAALAGFYAELLGLPITWQDDDFVVVSRDDAASGIGFQLAPDFQPHTAPGVGRTDRHSGPHMRLPMTSGLWHRLVHHEHRGSGASGPATG
jgi:catechol 2,3-dioxygenase-like lactoylglutathione lyase family enzyme